MFEDDLDTVISEQIILQAFNYLIVQFFTFISTVLQ